MDVLDSKVLDQLRKLPSPPNANVLAQLIALFAQGSHRRLARIREGLASGDAAQLRCEAHALRGGAGALGARQVEGLCLRLEEMAMRGSLSEAAPLVACLGDALAEAEKQLAAFAGG